MKNLVKTEIAVKTEILSSEDGNRTYSIKKEITGIAGSHAYFILLYPTRTQENCYVEDSTNNHLLNHLAELGLNSYTIINLFAQVTQSRLSLAGLTVDEENMNYIKETVFSSLTDDSKVVIAWGNSQQNSPVICQSKQRILELWESEQPSRPLYQLTADGMKNDNIGVHPIFLEIRHNQSYWKLENEKETKSKATEKNSAKGKKDNRK